MSSAVVGFLYALLLATCAASLKPSTQLGAALTSHTSAAFGYPGLKVINAGLPRTGTGSLHAALDILGYANNWHDECNVRSNRKCVQATCEYFLGHTPFDAVAKNIIRNRVTAIHDEPLCMLYKEFAEWFPKSKVILLVRDSAEDWYKSFERMKELEYQVYRADRGLSDNKTAFDLSYWETCDQIPHVMFKCDIYRGNQTDSVRQGCIDGYLQHNQAVKTAISPERLLVFNVKEGWGPLCEFLGLPVPEVPFPWFNDYMHNLELRAFLKEHPKLMEILERHPKL